jgi:hypothetical protein
MIVYTCLTACWKRLDCPITTSQSLIFYEDYIILLVYIKLNYNIYNILQHHWTTCAKLVAHNKKFLDNNIYYEMSTCKILVELPTYLLSFIYGYISFSFVVLTHLVQDPILYIVKGFIIFANLYFWEDVRILDIWPIYK